MCPDPSDAHTNRVYNTVWLHTRQFGTEMDAVIERINSAFRLTSGSTDATRRSQP